MLSLPYAQSNITVFRTYLVYHVNVQIPNSKKNMYVYSGNVSISFWYQIHHQVKCNRNPLHIFTAKYCIMVIQSINSFPVPLLFLARLRSS